MRIALGLAAFLALAGQAGAANAYSCNERYYVNRSGNVVHSPSCGEDKRYHHTAECRDGSTSFSEHHSGTCSHHGGVAHWD